MNASKCACCSPSVRREPCRTELRHLLSRRRLTLEPINHDLSAALHGALMVIGGIWNLLLHPSGFDGAQRSSRLLDLVRDAYHYVLDLTHEILDVFTSAYGIRCIGCPRFVSDNLLRAKRNACAIHQQRKALRHESEFFQQDPSVRRIVVVTKRKSKTYGRSSIRGNDMNLGIPSAPGICR